MHKGRKLLSLLLTFAMTLSLFAVPVMADDSYNDIDGHWAKDAIERWSGYDIVNGADGAFMPDASMTRAQLAKVLANMLGLTEEASPNPFSDVASDAWYAPFMLRCYAAGIMLGSDGKGNPDAPVSRQEAMTMIARALNIDPVDKSALTAYSDVADVAPWAAGYVAALTLSGIVGGMGDGTLAPGSEINRASVMTVFDKAIVQYINKPGAYTLTDKGGIVLVAAGDVTLSGTTSANVLVTAAADGKAIAFDKASVTGRIVVQADNARLTASADSKLPTPTMTGTGSTFAPGEAGKKDTAAGGGSSGGSSGGSGGGSSGGGGNAPAPASETVTAATGANESALAAGTYQDVTIADTVGDGTVLLQGVTIQGDLTINGGGSSSVILDACSILGRIIFGKKASAGSESTRVYLKGGTDAENVVVNKDTTGAILESEDATSAIKNVTANEDVEFRGKDTKAENVTVPEGAKSTVTVKDATLDQVDAKGDTTIEVDGATLNNVNAESGSTTIKNTNDALNTSTIKNVTASDNVTIGTDVENVEVPANAEKKVGITVADGGRVESVDAKGEAEIKSGTGGGTVGNVNASADVTADSAVVDQVTVPEGTTESVNVEVKGDQPLNIAVASENGASIKTETSNNVVVSLTEDAAKSGNVTKQEGAGEAEKITHVHKWDDGVVTNPATCTETGVKTYTCTAEGCTNPPATKTETIARLGHDWGDWTSVDNQNHQRVCKRDATHVQIAAHTWDEGKITTPATAEADGVKTYTCTGCGTTKTEMVPYIFSATVRKSTGGTVTVLPTKGAAGTELALKIAADTGYEIESYSFSYTEARPDAPVSVGKHYERPAAGAGADSDTTTVTLPAGTAEYTETLIMPTGDLTVWANFARPQPILGKPELKTDGSTVWIEASAANLPDEYAVEVWTTTPAGSSAVFAAGSASQYCSYQNGVLKIALDVMLADGNIGQGPVAIGLAGTDVKSAYSDKSLGQGLTWQATDKLTATVSANGKSLTVTNPAGTFAGTGVYGCSLSFSNAAETGRLYLTSNSGSALVFADYNDFLASATAATVCHAVPTEENGLISVGYTWYPTVSLSGGSAEEPAAAEIRFEDVFGNNSTFLSWNAVDGAANYGVALSKDGGASWTDVTQTSQTFVWLALEDEGTYNAVRIQAKNANSEVLKTMTSTELSVVITRTASTEPAAVTFTPTGNTNEFTMDVSGLTDGNYETVHLSPDKTRDKCSFGGTVNNQNGKNTSTVSATDLSEVVKNGYYLVNEHDGYSLSADGKTFSYRVVQRGDWTKCTAGGSGESTATITLAQDSATGDVTATITDAPKYPNYVFELRDGNGATQAYIYSNKGSNVTGDLTQYLARVADKGSYSLVCYGADAQFVINSDALLATLSDCVTITHSGSAIAYDLAVDTANNTTTITWTAGKPSGSRVIYACAGSTSYAGSSSPIPDTSWTQSFAASDGDYFYVRAVTASTLTNGVWSVTLTPRSVKAYTASGSGGGESTATLGKPALKTDGSKVWVEASASGLSDSDQVEVWLSPATLTTASMRVGKNSVYFSLSSGVLKVYLDPLLSTRNPSISDASVALAVYGLDGSKTAFSDKKLVVGTPTTSADVLSAEKSADGKNLTVTKTGGVFATTGVYGCALTKSGVSYSVNLYAKSVSADALVFSDFNDYLPTAETATVLRAVPTDGTDAITVSYETYPTISLGGESGSGETDAKNGFDIALAVNASHQLTATLTVPEGKAKDADGKWIYYTYYFVNSEGEDYQWTNVAASGYGHILPFSTGRYTAARLYLSADGTNYDDLTPVASWTLDTPIVASKGVADFPHASVTATASPDTTAGREGFYNYAFTGLDFNSYSYTLLNPTKNTALIVDKTPVASGNATVGRNWIGDGMNLSATSARLESGTYYVTITKPITVNVTESGGTSEPAITLAKDSVTGSVTAAITGADSPNYVFALKDSNGKTQANIYCNTGSTETGDLAQFLPYLADEGKYSLVCYGADAQFLTDYSAPLATLTDCVTVAFSGSAVAYDLAVDTANNKTTISWTNGAPSGERVAYACANGSQNYAGCSSPIPDSGWTRSFAAVDGAVFDVRAITASTLSDGVWSVTMTPESKKTYTAGGSGTSGGGSGGDLAPSNATLTLKTTANGGVVAEVSGETASRYRFDILDSNGGIMNYFDQTDAVTDDLTRWFRSSTKSGTYSIACYAQSMSGIIDPTATLLAKLENCIEVTVTDSPVEYDLSIDETSKQPTFTWTNGKPAGEYAICNHSVNIPNGNGSGGSGGGGTVDVSPIPETSWTLDSAADQANGVYSFDVRAVTSTLTNGVWSYTTTPESKKTYTTGDELAARLKAGGTVTLTEDIVTRSVYMDSGTATLDLNGHNITLTSRLYVWGSANLTITGNGTISTTGDYAVDNQGTLTISGGTFRAAQAPLYQSQGSMTISGGSFIREGTPSGGANVVKQALMTNGGTIAISGGEFDGGDGGTALYIASPTEVSITGGTFKGTGEGSVNIRKNDNTGTLTITGGTFDCDPSAYVNTNTYNVTKGNDNTWTVTANS